MPSVALIRNCQIPPATFDWGLKVMVWTAERVAIATAPVPRSTAESPTFRAIVAVLPMSLTR